ncbi:MAG: hypothetical protein ABJJ53_00945 [Sulfitobacter sp.]
MTNLIYIVGSGRSGSTVIERVLNSAPQVLAVGEIHALWRLPLENLLCSCGETVPDCPFWVETLKSASIGVAELSRLSELENSVVRNKYLIRKRFDLTALRSDPEVNEFNHLQGRLFDAARAVSGAKILLDSSKAGPRAWVLAAGFDPVFLHAFRSAEDVIASWRRPKFEPSTQTPMKKPPISEAALDWIKVEQSARSLAKVAEVRRVSYQHFANAPREALSQALNPSFPGLVGAADWVGENAIQPAQEYHSVLGNPDRFDKGVIQIRPQRAAASHFSTLENVAIRSVGRALEAVYR